ncbi:orotidine-5'-phosphate decarboxylase [Glaciihabitans arcticus]|uniref:Orotidine-5'-phosphate decarboxylase n=1 Tax=Glaciihabitans arcticus TaxID=2668039 RepID=A0A4Q9GVR2_9MICO|nr:orotidine-5'-phosphate decarboxylase [Glaciihabitans arcticus]TBN56753.1 orotidine-5'-phosphate decarboxylase [Glaciihabitans arcticus]
MTAFGQRLSDVFAASGQLCVGIDPHPYLMSEWGIADTPDGLREFGLRVVEAAVGRVGILKPQVAFFERHGSAGFAALETVFAAARSGGLLVIADAKRGDVGSTVEAYGRAWLTPGSPLEADAMTISAFQGVGSIGAPRDLALATGKGLFVLAATSNPESASIQTARGDAGTVTATILSGIRDWNTAEGAPLGSVGAVIGATVDFESFGFDDASLAVIPVLAPGLGHQGASFSDLRRIYGSATPNVVVSASRIILSAGPSGLAAAITAQADEVAKAVQS